MTKVQIDEDALTRAHVAVEDVLIEMRDSHLSVLGPANGFVVKDYDGTDNGIMRLGTRAGLKIAIEAYLAAIQLDELTAVEREYLADTPDFVSAYAGGGK